MVTPSSSFAPGAQNPPSSSITHAEMTALVRQIQCNQLYNRQLSSVCQVNGLKSTGVKADLQRRITDLIQDTYNSNDVSRFHQVRQSIANAMTKRPSPQKATPGRSTTHVQMPPLPSSYSGDSKNNSFTQGHGSRPRDATSRPAGGYPGLVFQASPFYSVERPLSDVITCPIMSQHRNSVHVALRLNDNPALQSCVDNTSYRVMVFCAGEASGVQHIAFPHQSELKVNGGDFKVNLRGLKNKPGSTRPADITSALRLKPSYTNNVEFTYALTNKKFFLAVYLCKVKSVQDLVSVVSTRQRIPKESVIAEINKKALDPDVVAVSQVLSLKCPLSYMRLDVPCRGTQCTHIQCFDATSYLQLQEQGPQWVCPICSKPVPFEQLAVDEYVRDILQKSSQSLEAVTIEPDGRWTTKSAEQEKTRPSAANATSFGDDAEIEISEVSVVGGRRLDTSRDSTSVHSVSTPASANRGGSSAAPRGVASTSAKRPAPQVIDLTLSSDEDDDEPIQRPAKRQNTRTNGFRESTGSLGFLSESPLGYPR